MCSCMTLEVGGNSCNPGTDFLWTFKRSWLNVVAVGLLQAPDRTWTRYFSAELISVLVIYGNSGKLQRKF